MKLNHEIIPGRFLIGAMGNRVILIWVIIISFGADLRAWVYPEHRQITLQAVQRLDSVQLIMMDSLWAEARMGYGEKLNVLAADTADMSDAGTIDFAAWPAIAGDHSCSAANMQDNILHTDWIIGVNRIGAQLKNRLKAVGNEHYKRTNALRDSDYQLMAVDLEYATRAGSNNVHFLLSKMSSNVRLPAYLGQCLRENNDINSLGVYAWYHLNALAKAAAMADSVISPEDRPALARAILADEAFALHFLQDAFAAGHIAGSWGEASLRKGTHDYYNEFGLEVKTWNGGSFAVLGDAWMRDEDAERASLAVQKSLEQVLDAARGMHIYEHPGGYSGPQPDSLNLCSTNFMPYQELSDQSIEVLARVVDYTPVPGLQQGIGQMPRFNAELGPFFGFSSALRIGWHQGGFLVSQNSTGLISGVELAARFGLGLEGVMNQAGDGLIFVDLGLVRNAASSLKIYDDPGLSELGAVTAAIPARSATLARIRMPFWLIPLDLMVAAPVLWLTSQESLTRMVIRAANGGLLGWQSGIATSVGRFQFILGREAGIYFYGHGKDDDRVLAYSDDFAELLLLDIRSVQIDLPILEYRSLRSFSQTQSSSLHVQFYASLDIPTSVQVVEPIGVPAPEYRTIWHLGIRASLDWRHYF